MSKSLFNSFPLEIPNDNNHEKDKETIKWSLGRDKHNIVTTILHQFEIGHIMAHCLKVMAKITQRVGANNTRQLESYRSVLPCTLSLPLQAVWDNVVIDFPLQNETVASFHEQLKHFFAANCSENDCHELIEYIQRAQKPQSVCVQAFFFCLRELNMQASWLPGQAAVLTAAQIDQAFFDGMPVSWRNRYSNAGRSIQHDNRVDMLRFFCLQESTSDKSTRDNNKNQRLSKSKRRQDAAAARFNDKAKGENKDEGEGKKKGNKKRRGNGNNNGKDMSKEKKITAESKCPIHPQGQHTWGECFQNAANANKPKPAVNKKGKKDKEKDKDLTNGHALQETTHEEGSEASVATITPVDSDAPIVRAINDQPFGADLSYKSDIKDLCDKLIFGLGNPKELLAEFWAKHEPFTHHFNDLSFTVLQESPKVSYDELVGNYVQYIDESYSLGVSESSIKQSFDVSLHLHATSYAVVQTMQNTHVDRLLRVLFDSGSDKTMLK